MSKWVRFVPVVGVVAGYAAVHRAGRCYGSTAAERAAALPGDELVVDPLMAGTGLTLAAPQVRTDLRTVMADRAARPLVEAKLTRRDADLLGDERHRLVRQLTTSAREPAQQ